MAAGRPYDYLTKEETKELIFSFIDRKETDRCITNNFKDEDFYAYYLSEFIREYLGLNKDFQTETEAKEYLCFEETNTIGYDYETHKYLSGTTRESIIRWYLEGDHDNTESVWWSIELEFMGELENIKYGGELFGRLGDYLRHLGYENNLKDEEIQQALFDDVPFDWILEKIQIKDETMFTGKLSRDKIHELSRFMREVLCLGVSIMPINFNNRTPIIIGESNNNKLLSYLFYRLEEKGYVVKNWQSRISGGLIFTKGGKILNTKDLNSAKTAAKQTNEERIWRDESRVRKKYKEVDLFIESL